MKVRIDKLDTLFSQFIKLRAKNHCERCGKFYEKGLQCCHMFTRRKHSVRYDEDNACACCFGCHQFLDSHPLEKIDFFKVRLGNIGFDMLSHRVNQTHPKPDRKAIELYLKSKIRPYLQSKIKEIEDG